MLALEADGAQLYRHALSQADVNLLIQAIADHDCGRPGARLSNLEPLERWLGVEGVIGRIAAAWLGTTAAPVRAILFDKNATNNWSLGWHQDRTIAVADRADVESFSHWNRKDGVDHVEPPFELIERMLTVRIHADPVSNGNAPLLIAPGTHHLGLIKEEKIADAVATHGTFACLADAGDVWVYRTAILHASKRAFSPDRRRVLQVDYSADELPSPLRWFLG